MHLAELQIVKEIPSPLWGGLGWGSLRSIQSSFLSTFKIRATPTPTLPTRGRGKSSEVLIQIAQCAVRSRSVLNLSSRPMFYLAALVLASTLVQYSCATAGVTEIGKPDCTECAIDAFPPDLSGDWSEFCSVLKKAKHTLQFKQIGSNYVVIDGSHKCNLTDIVDYNIVERRYFVRNERDCTAGVPAILISEFRLNQDNYLEITSKLGKRKFVDCTRGSINAPR